MREQQETVALNLRVTKALKMAIVKAVEINETGSINAEIVRTLTFHYLNDEARESEGQ